MFPKRLAVCLTPLLAGVCVLTSALESRAELKPRAPGRLAAKSAVAIDLPALHPNLARGWRAEARFDADDAAAIDLFNGNLSFGIPVGQPYRVDSQLSYALELRYNSQIWDFSTVSGATQGKPMAYSNAGLGFDLSLGRLIAPATANNPTGQWIYVSPDGGQHLFYSSLHHDTPDTADSGDTTQYTRDGSYLRLRHGSRSAAKRVEHGDGVIRTFSLVNGEWRVTRIASQPGNAVDITYSTDGLTWTLADSIGRIAVVRLQSLTDPFGTAWRLVDRVELPAFGNQVATYVFSYSFAAVGRACTDARSGTETVPLLSGVTDPVGQTYQFEYTTNGSDCHDNGRVKRYKIAAGGSYGFDYGQYTFPSNDCVAVSPPAHFNVVSGVVQRRKLQPDGTVVGTWTYTPQVDAAAGGGCGFDGRRTVVVTPLGHKEVYHFAVGTDAPSAGGPALYGLPIAPTRPHPAAPLYLTEEVYSCPAGADCTLMRTRWAAWTQDQACGSTSGNCFDTNRRLSRWQEVYEDDEPVSGAKRFKDVALAGYDGLGSYRLRTETSNFGRADSLSTLRFTNAEAGAYPPGGFSSGGGAGFFAVPAIDQPWFLADYSYLRVTDDAGAILHTDACFSAQGWLLRTRRRATATVLSAHDVVTDYAWHGGQPIETSLYGGDLQSVALDADLCALPLPSGRFAIQREYQNGVLARQVHLDDNDAPLPFYTVDRDIDLNTGKPVVERDVSGLATAYEYDLLGRTVWEKPAEGAWTQSVYSPPNGGSAWNSGPGSILYRRPNGGGTPLQTTTLLADVFGRRTGEWLSMPGGVISGRRFQYNAMGWKTAESTAYQPGTSSTLFWTSYLDFNPFGRAQTVRPPEGSAHDQTFTYLGDREVRRLRKVAKAYVPSTTTCVEDTLTEITRYDGQGRVWVERQEQPQPLQGRTAEVELTYHVSGQPSLRIERKTVGTTQETTRAEYTYDGRGFALASTTRTASGRIFSAFAYSDYDARGLFHRQEVSGDLYPAAVATSHSYDAAGRLVAVADAANPGKLWKEFFYGEENGNDLQDRRLGRLVRTVRHNYFETAHHTVTDSYVYAGLGGRVSQKTTDIHTVSSASMELRMDKSYRFSTVWDQLGNPSQIGYPVCLSCSAGEPTAALQLTYGSSQGLITSITGTRGGAAESWLSNVSWDLAGIPEEVTHANGVRDVYGADPQRQARLSSVTVYGPSSDVRFASGTFVYDGTGRQCGIGPRGLVFPPPELVEDDDTPAPCAFAHEIDPFALWNGKVTDASCRGNLLESYSLYDALDHRVASLDRKALKKLLVNGQPHWVADPENFVRTWYVYGLKGELLTKVDDHFSLGWRSSLDHIHGLGKVQGKASRTAAAPGFVVIYHQHPLEVRSTRPNGWAWPSEP